MAIDGGHSMHDYCIYLLPFAPMAFKIYNILVSYHGTNNISHQSVYHTCYAYYPNNYLLWDEQENNLKDGCLVLI